MSFPGGGEPVLQGEGVFLRYPRMKDFAAWSELRAQSRAFLTPWEPVWAEDDWHVTRKVDGTNGIGVVVQIGGVQACFATIATGPCRGRADETHTGAGAASHGCAVKCRRR